MSDEKSLKEQFNILFDDLDDEFIENEEDITAVIAYYIDNHLSQFCEVK